MAITNDFFTALNDPKAAMWSAGVAFNRSNPLPLDKWSVFQTMDEAVDYAEGNAVAYPGQLIAVYDAEAGVMTACVLQESAEGKLEPVAVGTTPVGDESTIVVAEDGTVSLAGVSGLVFTETSEGGEEVEVTYQPLLTSDGLIWVKPSATTVEGLATELEGLKARVGDIETAIGNVYTKEEADSKFALAEDYATQTELDEAVGDLQGKIDDVNAKIGEVAEGKTVTQMISDAQTAATYDDTDIKADIQANSDAIDAIEADYLKAADKTELQGNIDKKADQSALEAEIARAKAAEEKNAADIALILENPDTEAVDSIKEFISYIDEHGEVATGLQTQITENKTAVEDEVTRAKAAEEALAGRVDALEDIDHEAYKAADTTLSETLMGEINKKADASTVSDMDAAYKAADADMSERITALEGVEAEKNIIASVDETQFNVDADRKLTLLDVAMGKVAGLTDALAGKVNVVEGERLMTDAEGTKLEGIEAGAQVNVIDAVDEDQFAIGENKTLTLLDIAMGKVTGLQDALDGKANNGTTLAEYGITDAYTKTETLAKIAEKITEINGGESAGEVLGQLNSYKETNDARVDALEENIVKKVNAEEGKSLIADTLIAKLEAIEAGAQVNKIEAVKVGDTLLEIVDKTVVIPVGAGLKASEEITIAEDGALGVGKVNVNKLVQTDGESLILNGGAAQ